MTLLKGHTLVRFAVAAAAAFAVTAPSHAGNCPRSGPCIHGWGDSFYLNGVRYPGGNPRGPASVLNNWEGGFHPVAFWTLLLKWQVVAVRQAGELGAKRSAAAPDPARISPSGDS